MLENTTSLKRDKNVKLIKQKMKKLSMKMRAVKKKAHHKL